MANALSPLAKRPQPHVKVPGRLAGAYVTGEVVGQFQDDPAKLRAVGQPRRVRLGCVGAWLQRPVREEHARRAGGEDGGGGADPRARRSTRPGDDLRQGVQPWPELLEAVLLAVGTAQ